MSVASLQFLLFSIVAIAFYQAAAKLGSVLLRDVILLSANLYFLRTYSVGGLHGFVPMAGFICLGFLGAWILQSRKQRSFLFVSLAITIVYFCWMKKYAFVPGELFLSGLYVKIGLSYMFFRILQLQIDSNSNNLQEFPGVLQFLNYVLNFTTLISGPIQRYEFYLATYKDPIKLTWYVFGIGIRRISLGMFKVLVIAALLHEWHVLSLVSLSNSNDALLTAINSACILVSYVLYLYANFSGYTDIVIGVAYFLGMELPENFDRPFSALNFMDFWARWHMTLSNWLKTYVYNPLAKSLMEKFPSDTVDPYIGVFAFLVTFFLIGIWHGQTAVFFLYGLLLGVGVSGNKLYQIIVIKTRGKRWYRELASRSIYQAVARGLTFTYFSLSLVCFWADWKQITELVGKLRWTGSLLTTCVIFLLSTLILDLWERSRRAAMHVEIRGEQLLPSRYLQTVWVTAMILITIAVVSLSSAPAPDIVYKNF